MIKFCNFNDNNKTKFLKQKTALNGASAGWSRKRQVIRHTRRSPQQYEEDAHCSLHWFHWRTPPVTPTTRSPPHITPWSPHPPQSPWNLHPPQTPQLHSIKNSNQLLALLQQHPTIHSTTQWSRCPLPPPLITWIPRPQAQQLPSRTILSHPLPPQQPLLNHWI